MDRLYQSCPLATGSECIRLLQVQELINPGNNEEPIQCTLRVVDLQDRPSFSALSYVWGTKSAQSKTIICGITAFNVTDNCHSALKHLRQSYGSTVIWIDAVCIDQHNDEEKGQQVALMGVIYSRAQRVFIWLGNGTDATDRAIASLKIPSHIETTFAALARAQVSPSSLDVLIVSWAIYKERWSHMLESISSPKNIRAMIALQRQKSSLIPGSCQYIDDLYELLGRERITRIWTYQELMLATNPIVVCGKSAIHWPELALKVTKFD